MWGLFPLYWRLLDSAGAIEILAHRIVWSFVGLGALLAVTSGFRWIRQLDRRRALLLALAAALMTVNWGVFIYAVNSDRVVETSLGYFMTPLVSVALAVGALGERLGRLQSLAVAIAAAGVAVQAIGYGRLPWISLALAFSFGLYGLVKNRVGIDGVKSLAVESMFLVLPATAYLLWLGADGGSTFTSEGAGHTALLVGGGAVTATPLILFGAAAIRIPLATLGLLQYINPVMQFLIGVLIYHEDMPAARLAGFILIWAALIALTTDAVRTAREDARLAAAAPAAGGPELVSPAQ